MFQVIAKFRCVVRVVATLPAHPRDFQAPCGTYRLRLTLEDPTARIHAYLYAEDGVCISLIQISKPFTIYKVTKTLFCFFNFYSLCSLFIR